MLNDKLTLVVKKLVKIKNIFCILRYEAKKRMSSLNMIEEVVTVLETWGVLTNCLCNKKSGRFIFILEPYTPIKFQFLDADREVSELDNPSEGCRFIRKEGYIDRSCIHIVTKNGRRLSAETSELLISDKIVCVELDLYNFMGHEERPISYQISREEGESPIQYVMPSTIYLMKLKESISSFMEHGFKIQEGWESPDINVTEVTEKYKVIGWEEVNVSSNEKPAKRT